MPSILKWSNCRHLVSILCHTWFTMQVQQHPDCSIEEAFYPRQQDQSPIMSLDVAAASNCRKSFSVFTHNFWTFCSWTSNSSQTSTSPPMNQVQPSFVFFWQMYSFDHSFTQQTAAVPGIGARGVYTSEKVPPSGFLHCCRGDKWQIRTCNIISGGDNCDSETQSRGRGG